MMIKRLLCIGVILCTGTSCDRYPYDMSMAGFTHNGTYRAFKTFDPKTGNTVFLDTANNHQFLIFDADTAKIIRNDTLLERLLLYRFEFWLGRKKNGAAVYSGLTGRNRKFFRFSVKTMRQIPSDTQEVNLSPVMEGAYHPELDTLWTYYH